MMSKKPIRAGLAAAALVAACAFLLSHGVSAEEAAPAAPAAPTFNKGDNAWMLTSSVLVLLMTIP
jgi:Amt family ammonium transporter